MPDQLTDRARKAAVYVNADHIHEEYMAILRRKEMNVMLEIKALDAEKAGMEAANTYRMRIGCGVSRTYGDKDFFALAEKYRALKEVEPDKHVGVMGRDGIHVDLKEVTS